MLSIRLIFLLTLFPVIFSPELAYLLSNHHTVTKQAKFRVSGIVLIETASKKKDKGLFSDAKIVVYSISRDSNKRIAQMNAFATQTLDSEGRFEVSLQSGSEYQIYCYKAGYWSEPMAFEAKNIASGEYISIEITLRPSNNWMLEGSVLEEANGRPIAGASVWLLDQENGITWNMQTDEQGKYWVGLPASQSYTLQASKKGYFFALPQPLETNNKSILTPVTKLKPIQVGQVMRFGGLIYLVNEAIITTEGQASLKKIGEILMQNPNIFFEISCHTDARGDDAYNLELTQQRAQATAEFLAGLGVQPTQFQAVGFGETQLLNECSNGVRCSTYKHEQNRRLELKVVKILE